MSEHSDQPLSSAEIHDGQLDEFRALVLAAFEQAQSKGKLDWDQMTSAVLKNRLLALTAREFSEARYGSPTFIHLVRRIPDLLEIIGHHPPYSVRIRVPVGTTTGQASSSETTQQYSGAGTAGDAAARDWRKFRIRDDLWRAVIDYGTGHSYVLDPDTALARPRGAGDESLPTLPTASAADVQAWRQEWIRTLSEATDSRYGADLSSWMEGSGRQADLPRPLRGSWAEFMKKRVAEILIDWFMGRGEAPPQDVMVVAETRSLPHAETIDEVVRVRQLRDLIIRAVRTMTYDELAQLPLPASILLRVEGRSGL